MFLCLCHDILYSLLCISHTACVNNILRGLSFIFLGVLFEEIVINLYLFFIIKMNTMY